MIYSIQNKALTAQVSTLGAQLMSLCGADSTQYLWQGDPRYWSDRSLTIFPYVARLTQGSYRYQGKLYHMPIHGFGPTSEFTVLEHTPTSLTLGLDSSPETYAMYPFLFRFILHYTLEKATLSVELRVENRGGKAMYFGLGGHPGINVPLEKGLAFEDYCLEFPPCAPRRVEFTEECFITGEETPFPLKDYTLPLSHSLFDNDAIVLKGIPGRVTLRSRKGTHGVTLNAPDFPVFGFWHMPKTDAPYVCLEPWTSLPSRQNVVEDLEKQPDLIRLEPKNVYKTTWSLETF